MKQAACLVAMLAAVSGCTVERLGADAECERNSDCQDVLVCAARRCRPQCIEDRDCDSGLVCAPAGSFGLSACLAPDAPALCAVNSDCPEATLCVDGQCRAECLEDVDCADGSRCDTASSTCEAPIDRARDAGPASDGAVTPCADGGFACGGGCADLHGDPRNCGGCGVRCPANESCVDAYCVCEEPRTICGILCVDLSTSQGNCGDCGRVCDGPCNEATCCGAGRMSCGGTCIGILDDEASCGTCGNVCPADHSCVDGSCRVDNDRCEGAADVALLPGAVEVMGSTGGASDSRRSCASATLDVFYAITLTQRELVWLEVSGTNARAGFLNGDCATVGIVCRDPLCVRADPTTGSDAWAVLDAGRHLLVVDAGMGTAPAGFSLTIHHLPVADIDPDPIALGAFDLGGTLAASGDTPGSCSAEADRAHFFVTCPGAAGGSLTADTCATSGLDTVLGHASSLAPTATCNDDGACAPGAELAVTIPPDPALHVLYVESAAAGPGGAYRLSGTRP